MESLLLLCLLLTPLGVVASPALTIQSPDGDLIDCTPIQEQPAFSNPLLKDHQLQETPTDMVRREEGYRLPIWQIWHRNGTACLEGTIPVRRIISYQNETTSSNGADRATQGHEYAVGLMKSQPKIYGTRATMNVWRPTIEGSDEFSLGQIWLTSGSYNTSDLNSIEAGWQVDAYNNTGCYNLRCGGFVQTSRNVVVEGAIDQISTFGGSQADMTLKMWKDEKIGVWWLGILLEHGVHEPVGYWPQILFTGLRDHGERVQWGGEITNKQPYGRHTRTEMGSGYFPDSGFGNAAYMRNLEVAFSENDFQPLQELYVGGTHLDYYQARKSHNHELGTHFYYGGPRQLAIAVRVTWDWSLLYICFSFFLLI
ncbi:unnamed protein product [Microthlaspi erraticum]|uniref:Neprosin PEP catalytic domain-containing protein n=1 Tax=Microthlaspi erraticum TaxID=1685480 RepID=A0A6D2JEB3_9BRAS|nr:unnamed protein product [Microthlaspi erraticum]